MFRHINDIKAVTGVFTAAKDAAIISNGATLFTVSSGPILLKQIIGICVTGNDVTATTVQFTHTPTVGAAVNISIASASIASRVAGDIIHFAAQAFTNAPTVATVAASNASDANGIILPEGVLSTTVGVGPTTGTWKWYIRYVPLTSNSMVSA